MSQEAATQQVKKYKNSEKKYVHIPEKVKVHVF